MYIVKEGRKCQWKQLKGKFFEAVIKKFFLPVFLAVLIAGCTSDDDSVTKTFQLYGQARAYVEAKQYRSAFPILEQVSAEFFQAGKTNYAIEVQTILCQLEFEVGNYRSALDRVEKTKSIAHKDGNTSAEVQLNIIEGEIYHSLRDMARAYQAFESARSLADAFGNTKAELNMRLRIVELTMEFGNWEILLDDLESIISDSKNSGNSEITVKGLLTLDKWYTKNHKYVEAGNSLAQANKLAIEINNPMLEASCLEALGNVYGAMGNNELARNHFQKALEKIHGDENNRKAEVLLQFHVAQFFESKGFLQDAKQLYSAACENAKKAGDRLSENYLSLFLLQSTYALFSPAQKESNKAKLLQSYEQLVNRFQSCGHGTGQAYMLDAIGMIYERQGNISKASEYYHRAVDVDYNTWRDYYLPEWHEPYLKALGIDADHQRWYEHYAHSLILLNKPEEAARVLEQAALKQYEKEFQLLTISVRNQNIKSNIENLRSQLYQLQLLQFELGAHLSTQTNFQQYNNQALQRTIDSLRQVVTSASSKVLEQNRNFESFVLADVLPLSSYQHVIPRGAVVFQYCCSDSRLDILVLSRSSVSVRSVPIRRDSVVALVNTYCTLLHDPAVYAGEGGEASLPIMTRFALLSAQLYDVLIRPVESFIEQGVVIIPDPMMENLPFHALERQEKKTVQYFVEIANVDYLPTLGSLLYTTKPSLHLNTVTAFGNPTGKNWSIDYELRDIRSFFNGAKVFVGLDASWNNIKTTRADIIQLATGFQRPTPQYPLGALVVSDGLTVEGYTTVAFEKLMEIEASPVVFLSSNREQWSGISSSHAMLLRVNGVSEVFLNKWSADRKATKFFSEFFYTYLSQGLAPGDAYKQALLNLIRIRGVNHQRSWAQFFHYGIG
ncbi:MAG: CHAT domain-containing protein [Bacteroidetes bacterium]|nr:CHAT domain-containing protein [Bacteroidota bacterium]